MLDTVAKRAAADSRAATTDTEQVMEAAMASATHWVDCPADAAGFARAACASLVKALGATADVRRVPDGASLRGAAFGAATDQGVRLVLDMHGTRQASASLEHGSLSEWSKGKERRTARLDVTVTDAGLNEGSAERLVAALVKLLDRR